MTPAPFGILGLALVAVALVDLAWTTVAAGSGPGPMTGRLAGALWRVALAVHRHRRSHALLSFWGVPIVFAVLATWIALALVGWLLVFSSSEGAVRSADTAAPADLVERVYFTGYTVFTLGNGEYVPGRGIWQVATVAGVGTGLILVTLSITYLVPVASAVTRRRQLASSIASLGSDPYEILATAWTGRDFGGLEHHLVSLTAMVNQARQEHLTYPVLHYFHSQSRESAAPPNLANLSQALLLLQDGVAPQVRPVAAVTAPLDRAISTFLETLRGTRFRAGSPLPPPDLGGLTTRGIPTESEAAYRSAVARSETRRALLGGLLDEDGWRP